MGDVWVWILWLGVGIVSRRGCVFIVWAWAYGLWIVGIEGIVWCGCRCE